MMMDLSNYKLPANKKLQQMAEVFELVMEKHGHYLKLQGGASVVFNLARNHKSLDYRPTKDLDFYLYQAGRSWEEVRKDLEEDLKAIEGFEVDVRVNAKGNIRIFLVDKETNNKTQLDFEMISGLKQEDAGMASLDEILKKKLLLHVEQMDRRFKDVVDVMTILKYHYPEGITKKEITDLLGDEILELEKAVTPENLQSQIEQADKFKPKLLNDDRMVDYASSFFELLRGLRCKDLKDQDIFIRGKWCEG